MTPKAPGENKSKGKISITFDRAACSRCGICVEFCTRKVLVEDNFRVPDAAHAELCTECRLCELRCPNLAIFVTRE